MMKKQVNRAVCARILPLQMFIKANILYKIVEFLKWSLYFVQPEPAMV